MTDSPTAEGIGRLSQLLDGKIKEVAELRQLLTSELQRLHHNNHLRQGLLKQLSQINCTDLRRAILVQMEGYHAEVLVAIRSIHEKHSENCERIRTNYQREIFELETQLQKQYRLTRSMKNEVEELKALVDTFMKEKQTKEEPTVSVRQNEQSTIIPSLSCPKQPVLEIITEEDESQSTKRQPDDPQSPHLERPRITIKQYITLECLQSKLNNTEVSPPRQSRSPKFRCESRETVKCKENIEHMQETPPPSQAKQANSGSAHSSNKKPAKFFLEEFKKSFEKTLSENSLDRRDCITASSNLDCQELFSLEDSKKFESSGSTPTSTHMLGKVTFGKEKKFFSELEESQGEGPSEEFMKEVESGGRDTRSRERSTTANRSREKEPMPLCERLDEQSLKNPSYLLAHVKKKLNYNSMSSSNSNNQLRDKDRQNSYSSRDKASASKEDRYKLLIKNILNLKEKENHSQSAMLSRDKKKNGPASNTSPNLIVPPLFVGDHKTETKYEGAKRDGRRHGRGTLYFSNGLSYEGEFRDGLRCGYGILKFNNIEIYNGDWQRDMLNGQGRVKNCTVISRRKKEPSLGTGPQLQRWISYSGEFRDNRFHGTGTLFLQSGEKFLGKFYQGLAEGEGTFYKTNGQVEFGVCRNNVFSQKF